MTLNQCINALINYAYKNEMLNPMDETYVINRILALYGVENFEKEEVEELPINLLLEEFSKLAYELKVINSLDTTTTDIFDTELMNLITPMPSTVVNNFYNLYSNSKVDATNYYYNFSKNTNYIRMDRINKNIVYKSDSIYGDLDITINLSKPEKDPKVIAMAKSLPQSGYPKCLLCYQNEGFKGNLNHPARANHRIIPIKLDGTDYFMQYSPYVYYNEHTIVFNKDHTPMVINKNTFKRILSFVEFLPHYFLGSNADLPIVGGSILTHDHFQGGNYIFPMFKAPSVKSYQNQKYPNVDIDYIKWPLDTIRLSGTNIDELTNFADDILQAWIKFEKKDINIFASTNGNRHNTITPIARFENGKYQLYLVLRNNFSNDRYPFGMYHPDVDLHHIKKENIGLIEVMGLAVLPARLKNELASLKEILLDPSKESLLEEGPLSSHKAWFDEIKNKEYTDAEAFLQNEVGHVFTQVLEACGVLRFSNNKTEVIQELLNTI